MRKRRELVAARLALAYLRPDLPRCCHSHDVAYDAVVDAEGKIWNDKVHKINGTSAATTDFKSKNKVYTELNKICPMQRSVEEENLKKVKKFLDMVPLDGVREYKSCYDF